MLRRWLCCAAIKLPLVTRLAGTLTTSSKRTTKLAAHIEAQVHSAAASDGIDKHK